MEYFTQRQNLWFFVNNGKHVNPKSGLHRRMLVQIIEYYIRINISAQLNHNTHSITVRLIPEICYSLNSLLTNEFSNLLNQTCLVNLIRNLMHDNSCFVVVLFYRRVGSHRY
ncbi:hypothetical protein D3C81_1765610 [compost metagenome]